MKQVIKLTENDVRGLIKRCLMEVIDYTASYNKDVEYESDEAFRLDNVFIAQEVKEYIEYFVNDLLQDAAEGENDVSTRSFKINVFYSDYSILTITGTYVYKSEYYPGRTYGPPEMCEEDYYNFSISNMKIYNVEILYGDEQKEVYLNREDMVKYIKPIEVEINNDIDKIQ